METFDTVRDFWQDANLGTNPTLFIKEEVEDIINLRIKKEKKAIAGYFWLSLAFQILIYSFASHLVIKYWGDQQIMLLSVAGILLYIPLTLILLKKFKAMYHPLVQNELDIHSNIKNQYRLLGQFFSFKKKFDLVSIPLTAVILTGILFKLYVPGGTEAYPTGSAIVCAGTILIYGVAAWFENKKHFIKPLRRLRSILEDMEHPA